MKKAMPILLSAAILITAVFAVSKLKNQEYASGQAIQSTAGTVKVKPRLPKETRGIWVTYMTLDVENETDKKTAFESKIDAIIRKSKAGGFNTMIVQVRPFCDAIYPSKYYPWSHIISGEQGKDPGFDPLKIIVKKCRQNKLYIHAWINPYRIATKNTPTALSKDNPYQKHRSMCVDINGSRYLNPASKQAQKLIADGVREVVEKYDIDGVQFDDYFYPEKCGSFDSEDYRAYLKSGGKKVTLSQFRRNNVNKMVRSCCEAAHKADPNIVFGISPQGNLKNNAGLYADVKTWCAQKGYIDYICPQIYFSLDNPAMTFENCLNEWTKMKKHDALKFFVGLAGYKAGTDADSGTWLDNDDILLTEIKAVRKVKADGFLLYSYASFNNTINQPEIKNVMRYLTTSASQ